MSSVTETSGGPPGAGGTGGGPTTGMRSLPTPPPSIPSTSCSGMAATTATPSSIAKEMEAAVPQIPPAPSSSSGTYVCLMANDIAPLRVSSEEAPKIRTVKGTACTSEKNKTFLNLSHFYTPFRYFVVIPDFVKGAYCLFQLGISSKCELLTH